MTELSALGALAARSSWPDDYLTRNLAEVSRFIDETTRLEAVRDRDYDGLESDLRAVARWRSWTWKGAQRTTFGNRSRDEVLALRDQAKANLDAFIAASDADLAPLLHDALQTPIAAYEVLKAKAGRLDFLDLLIKARDLIRGNPAVRRELQRCFSHFFVDEFQDTDPLQAEILLLLAADDPEKRTGARSAQSPASSFWSAIRSNPSIGSGAPMWLSTRRSRIDFFVLGRRCCTSPQASALRPRSSLLNLAFAPAMAAIPDGGQAAYVPLEPPKVRDPRTADCDRSAGSEALWRLWQSRRFGTSIHQSLKRSERSSLGWSMTVVGRSRKMANAILIRPHHVAIVFRRFPNFGADITRAYVRALEVATHSSRSCRWALLHDREESSRFETRLRQSNGPTMS